MKTIEPNTTIRLINDPEDFKFPFFAGSKWEKQHYLERYYRLNNNPISMLEKPTYPCCGNFEEGVY
jgi:hypothetical protein